MLDEERPLLAERWPEMAAKIQKRLLAEGKITKEMIESYVDAYAGIYGDDTDAYVEEIIADTYAGMNRTDYGTNKLRADVKMEVGQWQKKSGSARAPPAKMSAAKDQTTKNYQGVNLAEDGSVYTYDFLISLPDMDVTMLPEVDAVRGAENRVDTAKVVQEGMKNARAVGTERDGKGLCAEPVHGGTAHGDDEQHSAWDQWSGKPCADQCKTGRSRRGTLCRMRFLSTRYITQRKM